MPQVGTDKKPMMISAKPRGKVLGLTGNFYRKDNKTKYESNYDSIFRKNKKG